MIKEFSHKIIASGDETEVYEYEERQRKKLGTDDKPVASDDFETEPQEQDLKSEDVTLTDESDGGRRMSDIAKIKQKIRRFVNANVGQWPHKDKFLTLTFADKEDGTEWTRDDLVLAFRRFKERFVYKYGKGFEYIAIIERGKENTERLHMHLIVFNLPYIERDEIMEVWQYGWIDITAIGKIGDVATYITKYVYKTLETDFIEKGKRFYWSSRGLKKPDVLYLTDEEYEEYLQQKQLGECVCACEFESQFVDGSCSYARYMIQRDDED